MVNEQKKFQLRKAHTNGFSLSCLLFILSIKILATEFRQDVRIKGIKVNDVEFKNEKLYKRCDSESLEFPQIITVYNGTHCRIWILFISFFSFIGFLACPFCKRAQDGVQHYINIGIFSRTL